MVHGLRMLDLFGGHVMRGAHDLSLARQAEVLWLDPQNLSQAEVGDLHAALFVQQHVLGLDVTVHHAFVVCVLEGFADLRDD